jgi:hypothetical protein
MHGFACVEVRNLFVVVRSLYVAEVGRSDERERITGKRGRENPEDLL